MRIAVAKPDWRIVGGFELLLAQVCRGLERRGHEIEIMKVDVPSTSRTPYGVAVPEGVWAEAPEYFGYLSLNETFRQMEFPGGTDIVLSTQPPSFAVSHPAHVSMFFHHSRIFYDLSDVYVAAGYASRDRHRQAGAVIREVDQRSFNGVHRFLVASQEVKDRLRAFNGVEGGIVSSFLPPPVAKAPGPGPPLDLDGAPIALCVSRHEFPKRTELFVQAMHLAPDAHGVCVGTGGREAFARTLDDDFAASRRDPATATDTEIWLNRGDRVRRNPDPGRVHFAGRATDDELATWYRSALCVVAPAYREDYGLTVLEAMSFGKPVIVCKDGGGLVELVEDGVTGFVVESTGMAVANAVNTLISDRGLSALMGKVAEERARSYTWATAIDQIEQALEQTRS